MFSKIIAIAGNTYLETIRQPIYFIILMLTCLMMVLNVSLAAYTLENDNLFLQGIGLSTLLLSGLFLAAFGAAGVLNREIEDKTVLTILSKPVSRTTLILGKFAGLITALTTAFYIGTLAFLLAVRHKVMMNTTDPWDYPVLVFGFGALLSALFIAIVGNYWSGWVFTSSFVGCFVPLLTLGYIGVSMLTKKWEFQFPILGDANLLTATFLVLLLLGIVSAIALAVSCRVGQAATLTICILVLMLGLTSDYFFGQHHLVDQGLFAQPTWTSKISWLLYRIIPNLSIFWTTDALDTGKTISGAYLLRAIGYATLYVAAFLSIGVGIFQKREVG